MFTVVGILLTFWASSVRDRHSDITILEAQAAAEIAHEKASLAELENTKLKSRLLDQEVRHADLLKKFGPRYLSDNELRRLSEKLKDKDLKGAHVHIIISGGEESAVFATNISRALLNFGIAYSTSFITFMAGGGSRTGMDILVTYGKGANELREAFDGLRPDIRIMPYLSRDEFNIRYPGRDKLFQPDHSATFIFHQKKPL